ncbi:MAG: sensor domain-containing diguanylate cyclase [Bryobacterales bacterium]|nr:sensor domain-containing diguanylate cyclase [Bryobacterales bacterium]
MSGNGSGSNDFYRSLLDSVSNDVHFVDKDRRISDWNPAAETISGYRTVEIVGHRCPEGRLLHCDATGKALCHEGCPLEAVLTGNQPETCEVFLRCRNGSRVPLIISASLVRKEEGLVIGVAEVFRDNSYAVSAMEEALRPGGDAYLDSLTEVGNRRFAEIRVQQVLELARSPGRPGALLFVDIDDFKHVNDTYGHNAGDQVLRTVTRTLRQGLRRDDLIGRWGGEEFVVYLAGVDTAEMIDVAERCRMLVASSLCSIAGNTIAVTCSIGAATIVQKDTLESLVARADAAMYQAKRQGRNQVCVAGAGERATVAIHGGRAG